jgi:uncharacterized protein with von Willebrand factor type A (vWA) domain
MQARVASHGIDEFYCAVARLLLVQGRGAFRQASIAPSESISRVERLPETRSRVAARMARLLTAERLFTEEKRARSNRALGKADGDAAQAPRRTEGARIAGGNKWVGTGGTSPFGNGGYHPEGIRIGGDSAGNRAAVKVWDQREFRNFDDSRRTGYAQHQGRLCAGCVASRAKARRKSSISTAPSVRRHAMPAGST